MMFLLTEQDKVICTPMMGGEVWAEERVISYKEALEIANSDNRCAIHPDAWHVLEVEYNSGRIPVEGISSFHGVDIIALVATW